MVENGGLIGILRQQLANIQRQLRKNSFPVIEVAPRNLPNSPTAQVNMLLRYIVYSVP